MGWKSSRQEVLGWDLQKNTLRIPRPECENSGKKNWIMRSGEGSSGFSTAAQTHDVQGETPHPDDGENGWLRK
jgi:hypothetical protein